MPEKRTEAPPQSQAAPSDAAAVGTALPGADKPLTIPELFRRQVARQSGRVARKFKRGGAWQEQTWAAWAKVVEDLARGVVAIGVAPRAAVGLLSQSRAEWADCDLAILSAGAITIPIYPSSTSDQVEYIVNNSEAVAIICENEEQLRKVLERRASMPTLKRAVLIEGRLPADAPPGFVIGAEDLKKEGWQVAAAEVEKRIAATKPDDVATIPYTSGTTGPPKGVIQTHANHYCMVANLAAIGLCQPDDMDLLFLPLAHSFARCEEMAQLYMGFTTAYAESIDKMVSNLADVKPTMLFSVPRIYEKLYAKIQADAAESPVKQKIVGWALRIGREVSRRQEAKEPIGGWLKLKYKLADKLVFSKIRAKLGGNLRFCVSGGAALAKEIAQLLDACGVRILEGYGLTETTPVLTLNRIDDYRFGTVGKAAPGVELKLAEDGEILGRGPNIAKGYYKRDAETKEVFKDGGWFATGDIGAFDADGFLRITDRKKDLFKTSGGKYIAPQELENKLKGHRFIGQAMIHGDKRKYVTVVVTLNVENVRAWAKEQGIEVGGDGAAAVAGEQLAKHPKVRELVQSCIDAVNKDLPSYETIKKFFIAPREWTPESGELTPTLKVKRKVVTAQFQKEIDALYDEKYE